MSQLKIYKTDTYSTEITPTIIEYNCQEGCPKSCIMHAEDGLYRLKFVRGEPQYNKSKERLIVLTHCYYELMNFISRKYPCVAKTSEFPSANEVILNIYQKSETFNKGSRDHSQYSEPEEDPDEFYARLELGCIGFENCTIEKCIIKNGKQNSVTAKDSDEKVFFDRAEGDYSPYVISFTTNKPGLLYDIIKYQRMGCITKS